MCVCLVQVCCHFSILHIYFLAQHVHIINLCLSLKVHDSFRSQLLDCRSHLLKNSTFKGRGVLILLILQYILKSCTLIVYHIYLYFVLVNLELVVLVVSNFSEAVTHENVLHEYWCFIIHRKKMVFCCNTIQLIPLFLFY